MWWTLSLGWTVIFWISGLGVPLAAILKLIGFQGHLSVLWDPTVLGLARLTFWQAGLSTLGAGLLGLLLGMQRFHPRAQFLLALPFGVPAVTAAMAWGVWLGRSGLLVRWGLPLDWMYSLKAVILAHLFFNIPWVALLVSQARQGIPIEQVEAARGLGCTRFQEFRFIIWPHIRGAFFTACAQVMAWCATSFALVLILGGGPPVQTLETQIYGYVRFGDLALPQAAACAVWELLITLAPWLLVTLTREHRSEILITRLQSEKSLRGWVFGLFFIAPYGVILDSKIWHVFFHPDFHQQIREALRVSLTLALSTATLTLGTAIAAIMSLRRLRSSHRRVADCFVFLLGLPSSVSILVLGLGFWIAYGQWLDPYEGSGVAIVVLQSVLFFPFVLRILLPPGQTSQRIGLEAARTLGASRLQAFWAIEWPRWRAPLLSAWAAAMGASLGEVGAVSLFFSEKRVPLPLLITRWMGKYHFEQAQSVAGLLLLLSVALMWGSLEAGIRVRRCGQDQLWKK